MSLILKTCQWFTTYSKLWPLFTKIISLIELNLWDRVLSLFILDIIMTIIIPKIKKLFSLFSNPCLVVFLHETNDPTRNKQGFTKLSTQKERGRRAFQTTSTLNLWNNQSRWRERLLTYLPRIPSNTRNGHDLVVQMRRGDVLETIRAYTIISRDGE